MSKDFQLEGKNVLITGGASGICYAIACEFLRNKINKLAILDINEEAGVEVAKKLDRKFEKKGDVIFIKCDVANECEIESAYKEVFLKFNSIGVFVHGAGIFDEKQFRRCVDVNLNSIISCTSKAFDHASLENGGKGGTVINISSIYGFRISSYSPVYHATKFAIIGYSRSMGLPFYYYRSGVRIMTLCPGFTESNLVPLEDYSSRFPNEAMVKNLNDLFEETRGRVQTAEHVAKELVSIFQGCSSGSVWVVEESKSAYEKSF